MSKQTEEIAKFREFQIQAANEKQIRQTLLRVDIKRGGQCWCGSGIKYKKCHWREELVLGRMAGKNTGYSSSFIGDLQNG